MKDSKCKEDNWLSARQQHIKELIKNTRGLAEAYAEYGQSRAECVLWGAIGVIIIVATVISLFR